VGLLKRFTKAHLVNHKAVCLSSDSAITARTMRARPHDRPNERRSGAGRCISHHRVVLNKKRGKSISRETAKRVWRAARELNYHVDVHARRLARGQSNLVGLIISEIANLFFPDVIRGFELAATQRGLELLLCNTEYQAERMESAVSKMLSEGVRGVAIMTSTFGELLCRETLLRNESADNHLTDTERSSG
jgi:hypothetical protein